MSSYMSKLIPEGFGSPLIEANSSYLPRFGELHSITVGTLMADLIFPAMGLLTIANSMKRGSSRMFSPHIVNGTRDLTIKIILSLEKLTSQKDLIYLTLLPLKGILAGQKVFRLYRTWCPICLQEQQSHHLPIYDALIWLLRAINTCPIHLAPLSFQCPRCNSAFPVFSAGARPGFCSRCGQWLGSSNVRSKDLREPMSDFDSWALKNVSELMAGLPFLPQLPLKATIHTAVETHINEHFSGSATSYAKKLGISRSTVIRWKTGITLPSLDHLLRICYFSQTSLITLITQGLLTSNTTSANNYATGSLFTNPGRGRKAFNRLNVKKSLEAILRDKTTSPLSMAQVARKLNYTKKTLYKHFPILCRHVSARAALHRKNCKEERLYQERLFIESTAEQMYLQGIYPSFDAVESASKKRALLRGGEAKCVWKNKLKELGLGNGA